MYHGKKMTIRETFFSAILALCLGALSAYAAWSYSTSFVVFGSLLFLVYLLSERRMTVGLFVTGFYMMTLRGLLGSVSYYYHSIFLAVVTWSLSIAIIVLPYVLIWSPSFSKRLALFPLMVFLLTIPPIGFLAGANPLASAGIFFPGFGLWGIVLYLFAIVLLAIFLHRRRNRWWSWLILFSVLLSAALTWTAVQNKDRKFKTTVSHFLYTPVDMDARQKKKVAMTLLKQSNRYKEDKTLFFENALGNFKSEDARLWHALKEGKRVYAGAYIHQRENPEKYDNALVKLTNKNYTVLYKQRVPMPWSMWVPFSLKGAQLHAFENPIVKDEGERLGVFICYEQVLAYPFIHTMLHKPTMLIGISNLWWARDETFQNAQRFNLRAWASLMGIPLYYSYNDRKR